MIAERANGSASRKVTEPKTSKREGPPVNFTAQGGKTDRDNAAALLLARQSPGFPLARQLLADAIEHRAEGIALDFAEQGVAVRYANRRRLAQPSAARPSRRRRDAGRVQNDRRAERQRTRQKAGRSLRGRIRGHEVRLQDLQPGHARPASASIVQARDSRQSTNGRSKSSECAPKSKSNCER